MDSKTSAIHLQETQMSNENKQLRMLTLNTPENWWNQEPIPSRDKPLGKLPEGWHEVVCFHCFDRPTANGSTDRIWCFVKNTDAADRYMFHMNHQRQTNDKHGRRLTKRLNTVTNCHDESSPFDYVGKKLAIKVREYFYSTGFVRKRIARIETEIPARVLATSEEGESDATGTS